MPIHKVIIGEGGEKYLPFALSRLRHLKIIGASTTAQKYTFEDGAVTVRVEYNPIHGNHFVRIDSNPGAVGYEFITTFDEVLSENGWGVTQKMISGVDTAKFSPKKGWVSPADPTSTEVVAVSPSSRAVNLQANPQYIWWPIDVSLAAVGSQVRTKPYCMTSTLGRSAYRAQGYDDQQAFGWNWPGTPQSSGSTVYYLGDSGTDLGPDIPCTIYEQEKKGRSMASMPTAPAWWRRSAVIEADGRRFVVMTDMQSNFRVVPASYATEGGKFLFPDDKGIVIPASSFLPAGVARPTLDSMAEWPMGFEYTNIPGFLRVITQAGLEAQGLWQRHYDTNHVVDYADYSPEEGADPNRQFQKHDYVWAFDSTGSRAVAVVHTNRNNGFDDLTIPEVTVADKQLSQFPVSAPWRRLKHNGPNVHVPSLTASAYPEVVTSWGGLGPVELFERALLEVSIDVSVTGDGEDDFTATMTVTRFVTGKWFLNADYAFNDARLRAKGVSPDDVIASELRLYENSDDPEPEFNISQNPLFAALTASVVDSSRVGHAFRVVRNVTTDQDVMSFCVMADAAFVIRGQWFRADEQVTGLFPGFEGLRYGPYGILEYHDPAWPRDPYVLWAYRGESLSDGLSTQLDWEDLRSLSCAFVNDVRVDGTRAAVHVVAFGEVVDRDEGLEAILDRAESDVQSVAVIIPPVFSSPMRHRAGFVERVPFPATDASTAFGIGLHRLIQSKTVALGQADSMTAGSHASHPDGHIAFVSVSIGDEGVAVSDQIRHRKVTIAPDGTRSEKTQITSHLAVLNKVHGREYNPDDFAWDLRPADADQRDPDWQRFSVRVLARMGVWRNIKTPTQKSGMTSGLNPRFEETP